VIPFGAVQDRPDYAWADGVQLRVYAAHEGQRTRVRIPGPDGSETVFEVRVHDGVAAADLISGATSSYTCTDIRTVA
jgi:alpha-D-xyloside xylohydrolase